MVKLNALKFLIFVKELYHNVKTIAMEEDIVKMEFVNVLKDSQVIAVINRQCDYVYIFIKNKFFNIYFNFFL